MMFSSFAFAAKALRTRRPHMGPIALLQAPAPGRRALATRSPTMASVKGVRQELGRVLYRTHKKASKMRERVLAAEADTAPNAVDLCTLRQSLREHEARLLALQGLADRFQGDGGDDGGGGGGGGSDGNLRDLCAQAEMLGIGPAPPPPQVRGPKKAKQPAPAARIPYVAYCSCDGVEIRVGRRAADNDLLSCDPRFRSGSDWWLHAAGYPGSHVIVRYGKDDLAHALPGTLRDAALLAAHFSKAAGAGAIAVTLTRARHVNKAPGSKPGMVLLGGTALSVTVNMKREAARLRELRAQQHEQ